MRHSNLLTHIYRDPFMAMVEQSFAAGCARVFRNMQDEVDEKDLHFKKTMCRICSEDGKPLYACQDLAQMKEALTAMAAEPVAVRAEDGGDGTKPQGKGKPFINMVCIEGDMTRDGDACTYGSKDHKQMIMEAADSPLCRGHIVYCNSGGGQASTLLDYREAYNYAYAKGQNVVMVVEFAGSACCFQANMGNRTFATRKDAEMGSMGMFCAFTTIKDGTTLPMTNEVMHIRYAPQSPRKNYAFREAAKGNMKPIDDMLKEMLAQTLADTKQDRPSVLDSQLDGDVWEAQDVMGSLVDELGGVSEAAAWLMNDWQQRSGEPLPIKDPAPRQSKPKTNQAKATEAGATNPDNKMYEQIAQALGMESIEHTDDGVMLNTPLADQLEAHLQGHADALSAKDKAMADALAQKDQEIADLKAAQEKAIADLTEAKEKEIADLKEAHQQAMADAETQHGKAIAKLNETLGEKETALTEANSNLAKKDEELKTANAQITDLNAKVEELNQQAPAVQAGAQPADNGQQAPQQPQLYVPVYQWNNSLSTDENIKAEAEFKKQHGLA